MDGEDQLSSIWKHRLEQVSETKPTNRTAAELAVERLYQALNITDSPQIIWYEGGRIIPVDSTSVPIWSVMDRLFVGHKIPDIRPVLLHLGYDFSSGTFRLTTNKPLLFSKFRIKQERRIIRPSWTHSLRNMISQFDAPRLALYQYAAVNKRIYPEQRSIGDAVQQVLDTTFGVILFEKTCVIMERPKKIRLDPMQLLSSTSGPAFQSSIGLDVYAVNGVIIARNATVLKSISWDDLETASSTQQRVAMIEYMGWEKFMQLANKARRPQGWGTPAKALLDKSRWGSLYEIHCGSQELFVLEVRNRTAEPDGTFRPFFICVDPDCRPMPNPLDPHAVWGDPQSLTALNAVASTFGMTGEEYHAMLGAES